MEEEGVATVISSSSIVDLDDSSGTGTFDIREVMGIGDGGGYFPGRLRLPFLSFPCGFFEVPNSKTQKHDISLCIIY